MTLKVVSEAEAAAMLGVHPATLRRMRKLNTGPSWVRLSAGRLGYPLDKMNDYIEAQSATTRAPRSRRNGGEIAEAASTAA